MVLPREFVNYLGVVLSSSGSEMTHFGPFDRREQAEVAVKWFTPTSPGLRWEIREIRSTVVGSGNFAGACKV